MEICRYPKQEVFHWRISMATVNKDGDFSLFEGYQRIITILKGEGIYLQQAQAEAKLIRQQDVFTFSGNQSIHCQLVNGTVIDFNLIFDPTLYDAQFLWLHPQTTSDFTTSANHVLLFGNECSSKVLINNSIERELFENDTLWITKTNEDISSNISVAGSCPIILIELWQMK